MYVFMYNAERCTFRGVRFMSVRLRYNFFSKYYFRGVPKFLHTTVVHKYKRENVFLTTD